LGEKGKGNSQSAREKREEFRMLKSSKKGKGRLFITQTEIKITEGGWEFQKGLRLSATIRGGWLEG